MSNFFSRFQAAKEGLSKLQEVADIMETLQKQDVDANGEKDLEQLKRLSMKSLELASQQKEVFEEMSHIVGGNFDEIRKRLGM